MKKNRNAPEMTRLNRAAFRFAPAELYDGSLEGRLGSLLAAVLGGDTTCTEFTCTLYAPGNP